MDNLCSYIKFMCYNILIAYLQQKIIKNILFSCVKNSKNVNIVDDFLRICFCILLALYNWTSGMLNIFVDYMK